MLLYNFMFYIKVGIAVLALISVTTIVIKFHHLNNACNYTIFSYPFIDIEAKQKDHVVKIIHTSWKNKDIPASFINYSRSWTKHCFKDWRHILWTDEDNLNLIKTHYPWFLDKYQRLPTNIYRADAMRYFYMFHYGGIYTDLDNECLRPFDDLLRNYSLVFGAMDGQWQGTSLPEGYVQNSFMYSKPRHEFWMRMMFSILTFEGKARPEHYTGPVLLSNTIKDYRQTDSGGIKIYLPQYFNPFSWITNKGVDKSCKTSNRMSVKEWQKCRSTMIKKGSYVVQYHAHTWSEV